MYDTLVIMTSFEKTSVLKHAIPLVPEDNNPIAEYTGLRHEDPLKIVEILGRPGGDVATIAASGTSTIIAFLKGVQTVESVDHSPGQIAFNYALQHIFLALNPESFLSDIHQFNSTIGFLGRPLSEPRQCVLAKLPDFLSRYNVPSRYNGAVARILAEQVLRLPYDLQVSADSDLFTWYYPENIQKIRNAIEENRWQLHEDDIIAFLNRSKHPYDAIYTSNVIDHLLQRKINNFPEFLPRDIVRQRELALEAALARSTKPKGVVNLHNMHGGLNYTGWAKIYLDSELWIRNWSIRKEEYRLHGAIHNGDWYVLTRKETMHE